MEPPAPAAVRRAVSELEHLEALRTDPATGEESLTALGSHLSTLPVDCRVGKLILFGAMLGVADEALTIAASLSSRNPFLAPPSVSQSVSLSFSQLLRVGSSVACGGRQVDRQTGGQLQTQIVVLEGDVALTASPPQKKTVERTLHHP